MSRSSYKKVVLAYSGGLDTSVILKWLSLALLPGDKSGRVERVCPLIA